MPIEAIPAVVFGIGASMNFTETMARIGPLSRSQIRQRLAIEPEIGERGLHRLLVHVTVIPVDERFLALEPREDDSLASRRVRGLDAETAGRRFERADHVGEAGGSRLGERWARPCEDERESD